MQINYSEISDGDFLIPEGEYLAKVTEIQDKETDEFGNSAPLRSKKGVFFWKLTLEIADGQYAGKILFDSFFFSEKALPHIKSCAKAVGIDTETNQKSESTPIDFIGKTIVITIRHDNWGGTKRSKVKFRGYSALLTNRKTDETTSAADIYKQQLNDLPF